ncbi:hypothetical protein Q7A_03690 [Methylophaga nitratireducenticrescens]|nr:hypothetical protein Q7A_03690 [Methylophaga nitratireducenticrescens]
MNSLAGRAAVKYRDVFHTTQAAAKIVPALRVVTEKAPLMSTDGQAAIAIPAIPAIAAFGHPYPPYVGAPGRRAPVCVAYMDVGQGREQDTEALLVTYLELLQKRPDKQCSRHCFCIHSIHGDKRF